MTIREPKKIKAEPVPVVEVSAEQVEAFASGADVSPNLIIDVKTEKPKPKRISWAFKEGEHDQLQRLAKKHKRSMLSLIRYAIDQLDKE